MRPYSTSKGGRRGNVTVIVVAFLSIFLVLGLTFVFYSIAEADQTKVYRDGGNGGQSGVLPPTHDGAPPEPETIFNIVMRDVIYGPPNDLGGAFDSFRGHDLSRLIYGFDIDPGTPALNLPSKVGDATQPFNGVGRVNPQLIHPTTLGDNGGSKPPIPYSDQMINFTWAPWMAAVDPNLQWMFDIDNNYARNPKLSVPAFNAATYRYYAKNANYTYPDLNNMFLAAMDPTSGRILLPSYERPYLMVDPSKPPMPPSQVPQWMPPVDPLTGPTYGQAFAVTAAANHPTSNPNPWTNSLGRYKTLRPRPVDHMVQVGANQWISYFPHPKWNFYPNGLPDGTYGDVENLEGKPGGMQYDSVWMDFDYPVRRWQGKNYKPLVALLIVDLDSRVNVNTAGNFYPLPDNMASAPNPGQQPPSTVPNFRTVMVPQYGHYSNQGIGPWEVNPVMVMPMQIPAAYQPISVGMNNPPNAQWNSNEAAMLSRPALAWRTGSDPAPPPEWKYAATSVHNRFAGDTMPNRRQRAYPNEYAAPPQNQPSPGAGAPFYGLVDFNGVAANYYPASGYITRATAKRWSDPGLPFLGHTTSTVFGPSFLSGPPIAYPDPDSRYDNGMAIPGTPYDERTGHPSMYNPYWMKTTKKSTPAGIDRTFGPEEMRFLNEKYNYGKYPNSDLAALASSTLGNSYFQNGQFNSRFGITTLSSDLNLPGAGPWLPNPTTGSFVMGATYPYGTPQPFNPSASSSPKPTFGGAAPDHDDAYRAKLAAMLGPVDLNRKLTDYRTRTDLPLGPDNVGNYQRALKDRQDLAKDIYYRLRAATTGVMPTLAVPGPGLPAVYTMPAPAPAEVNSLRWLAQLAVNIVDYIDNDDISTAFNWNPTGVSIKDGWVYGFERPRLVMNETYTRIENDPKDKGTAIPMKNNKRAGDPLSLRCWLELHNALTPGSLGDQNWDPMGDGATVAAPNTDPTHGGYRTNLEEKVHTDPTNLNSAANLQTAYRIVMYKMPVGQPQNIKMLDFDNVTGLPTPPANPPQGNGWPRVIDFTKSKSAPNGKTVQPNVQAQVQGKMFYVIGPSDDSPGAGGAGGGNDAKLPDNSVTADLTHDKLNVPLTYPPFQQPPQGNEDTDDNGKPKWVPMFVLQRLSNPYVVYNGDPLQEFGGTPDNQYVTVDYIDPDWSGNSVYDHIEFLPNGTRGPDPGSSMQPDLNTTYSWGRRQPYDARIKWNDQQHYRQGAGGAGNGQIGGHTFSKLNAKNGNWPADAGPGGYVGGVDENPGSQTNDTLQTPFMPLNHLDRGLLNPIELLHVVSTKPHLLTHAFFMQQTSGNPQDRRVAYMANWLDAPDDPSNLPAGKSTFLFRALDYLRPGSFIEGIPFGSRIPGRINVNTIHNNLTGGSGTAPQFSAIGDAQQANRFTQGDVDRAWQSFVSQRLNGGSQPFQSAGDKPMVGLAGPVEYAGMPTGNSQDATLARRGALWASQTGDETFAPATGGSAGPMQKFELFAKSFNQTTTRSNAFAIYATIGYFEVLNDGPYDDTNRPVLGKELGTDEGSVTRHKFFAIVDRTNLSIDQTPLTPKSPSPKQGTPPIYFDYNPEVMLPNGIPYNSPSLGLIPGSYNVMPDPDTRPNPLGAPSVSQVKCRIPVNSQIYGQGPPYPTVKPFKTIRLDGVYDGFPWTIIDTTPNAGPPNPQKMSLAILDVGDKAEPVIIRLPLESIDPTSSNGGATTATIILESAQADGFFHYSHGRGAPIRLINPDPFYQGFGAVPGNPGQQPGFQYKAPLYAPIVKYAEQIR
ncbi:MAG TPA: hypothetical protein VHR66_07880 [Gemmataceae bacterium]|jgi:hypothetical protein|nr:hypothetical protein [Gemmataceae bacterium]